jgi:hypothetical protein
MNLKSVEEAVVVYYKVILGNFIGWTDENYDNPQSSLAVCSAETGTSHEAGLVTTVPLCCVVINGTVFCLFVSASQSV